MLDLIYEYEETRFQLQKRIYELNKQLRKDTLMTIEREKLIARRDMLARERCELLDMIIELKKHLRKEELIHVSTQTHSGKYCRIRSLSDTGLTRNTLYKPETA
ncbi:MAG: hypothetical protein IJ642_00930 [Oscillospiraceae bacterium]|nr:hypothetical protein [Oscillospiraceae bacterium]